MYIVKSGNNIAKTANMCYYISMDNYFENKLNYNQISFCYTDKSTFEERKMHEYHEILYYIGGNATFLTEGFQHVIDKNTLLIIPKGRYHYFQTKSEGEFVRLKISFYDLPDISCLMPNDSEEIKIIKNVNNTMQFLLGKICSTLSKGTADEKNTLFIYGAFLMLLTEISNEKDNKFIPSRDSEHLISRCIDYVDRNLSHKISLETIAKELSISLSSLSHTFRKEMGISLHKYITEKRLIHAHKLICDNHNPTKIYLQCGYADYSSFYKAYLKMFGYPPSRKM